ncbi:MAG TPA: flagellar basal body-associated FliL family protein [Spirochaetota bacterium]|nr:flagellar basal body-associated FliL family protein [Spirochaetota bacterium]HNT12039.1 flagellar basal body-associated FliL family protein [Spirochaetota bacterium]HNV48005.1 flagellar basal body-associated FliL family protein [Spirochaetota bacterium]HOS40893.1 flagellar basal body-associated FliL family protein [Spirochaetota bacterium]HPI21979.1 flagellar basal body-associated FliL family protein [Spirochaetota bacterium]
MGDDEKPLVEEDEEESGARGEGEGQKSPTTSKIIKILLYVAGGILLIFIVFGISYLVSTYVQERRYAKEQDIVVVPPPAPLARYEIPVISFTTKDAEPHMGKIALALGYDKNDQQLTTELTERAPQLQHIINVLLRGKSYEDINSVEGMINLTEDIKAHINVVLINGKIKEIYYKEFIVN